MKNTYEQSFIEKLCSLLKFGANSRRYKDIFDMYCLRIVVSENKMKELISEVKDEVAKLDDGEDGVKKADIKNIGFSVKSDGSVSFFAELEKSSAEQKKRI